MKRAGYLLKYQPVRQSPSPSRSTAFAALEGVVPGEHRVRFPPAQHLSKYYPTKRTSNAPCVRLPVGSRCLGSFLPAAPTRHLGLGYVILYDRYPFLDDHSGDLVVKPVAKATESLALHHEPHCAPESGQRFIVRCLGLGSGERRPRQGTRSQGRETYISINHGHGREC